MTLECLVAITATIGSDDRWSLRFPRPPSARMRRSPVSERGGLSCTAMSSTAVALWRSPRAAARSPIRHSQPLTQRRGRASMIYDPCRSRGAHRRGRRCRRARGPRGGPNQSGKRSHQAEQAVGRPALAGPASMALPPMPVVSGASTRPACQRRPQDRRSWLLPTQGLAPSSPPACSARFLRRRLVGWAGGLSAEACGSSAGLWSG
jgi:hypothetical protein